MAATAPFPLTYKVTFLNGNTDTVPNVWVSPTQENVPHAGQVEIAMDYGVTVTTGSTIPQTQTPSAVAITQNRTMWQFVGENSAVLAKYYAEEISGFCSTGPTV